MYSLYLRESNKNKQIYDKFTISGDMMMGKSSWDTMYIFNLGTYLHISL